MQLTSLVDRFVIKWVMVGERLIHETGMNGPGLEQIGLNPFYLITYMRLVRKLNLERDNSFW